MLEVILATLVQGYRQAVRHSTLTAALVGSNPTSPAVLTKVIFFHYFSLLSYGCGTSVTVLHAGYFMAEIFRG